MKHGASLFYATDKNIYDALRQSKVNADTVQAMFSRRNIVCAKSTSRENLSSFFSRLTHDLIDHQDIAARLGIVPRRERYTSVDLIGERQSVAKLKESVEQIKEVVGNEGDLVSVFVENEIIRLSIKYSTIDFRKSEFAQVQNRTGSIEIIPSDTGLVVRSTKSDRVDEISEELVRRIKSSADKELVVDRVSLEYYLSPGVRTQFFYDLMTKIQGFTLYDVSDVYVFKPRPVLEEEEESLPEPHVEKILLKGSAVSQTSILRDLINDKEYYIVKAAWVVRDLKGAGKGYEVEAAFSDPRGCTGFTYILKSVREVGEAGRLVKNARAPRKMEIDDISQVVENHARQLMVKLELER